jgi:hypothetical protein
METDLVGLIYEDAMVFGLVREEDRAKWYKIISTRGVEYSDEYLCGKDFNRVIVNGMEEPVPWGSWLVVKKVDDMYELMPWTCDPEVEDNYDDFDLPTEVYFKYRGGYNNSKLSMYILAGHRIYISADELEKYNVYLTVMRYIAGDIERVCEDLSSV